MSYKTYSFVTKNEVNNELLKEHIAKDFPFHLVREIFTPFRGLVCQVYHSSYREIEFGRFNDNYFRNQDEVEDYFDNHTATHLVEFSKAYPDNDFAFIEVDCFGGKCSSNGHIIKNGEKVFENEPHHSGHMDLLKRLDANCESWFFYPFRRTFFQDKGGINGEIANVAFPALWMMINIDYGKNAEFDFQFFENEMLLTKINQYDLYFMKVDDVRIKVMGSFDVMSEENVNEVKNLIDECFIGMEYYFSLDNFETGEQIVLQTMDNQLMKHLAASTYRGNPFNERPLVFNDFEDKETENQDSESTQQQKSQPLADLEKDNVQDNLDEEKRGGISNFFRRLFGKG